MLGGATDEIINHLQRINSPENAIDLSLDGWSLELGPIELGSLSDDESLHVGWIAVSISGQGYIYPWTSMQLVARAEAHPRLQALAALCRAAWPVSPDKPIGRVRRARAKYKGIWAYTDHGLPWNWYWGVDETG